MFRLDRFLTLYFFYPLIKKRRSEIELRIPILMYHSISGGSENDAHPYYRLNTSPSRFAQQMKFLYDNNYQVISMREAVDLLNRPINRLPNQPLKYIVLTFDDGYCDFMTQAIPVLQNYGYTATVFLPTAFIGKIRKSFKDRKCLTWSEVRQLSKNRVSFGSHTVSHPKLYGLPWDTIKSELRDSKLRLEDEIETSVHCFSYPFAFPQGDRIFVSRFKRELSDQGYRIAVTTAIGCEHKGRDPLYLKRLPVNEGDDQRFFEAKINGAYDWLRFGQIIYKKNKGHNKNNLASEV